MYLFEWCDSLQHSMLFTRAQILLSIHAEQLFKKKEICTNSTKTVHRTYNSNYCFHYLKKTYIFLVTLTETDDGKMLLV